MRFVFTKRFFVLLAFGLALLSFGWLNHDALYYSVLYDIALVAVAAVDYFISEKRDQFRIERLVEDRFAMGAENEVTIKIANRTGRKVTFILKDEYPPQMELRNPREVQLTVTPGRTRTWRYGLLPTARGSYEFGSTILRFRTQTRIVVEAV